MIFVIRVFVGFVLTVAAAAGFYTLTPHASNDLVGVVGHLNGTSVTTVSHVEHDPAYNPYGPITAKSRF